MVQHKAIGQQRNEKGPPSSVSIGVHPWLSYSTAGQSDNLLCIKTLQAGKGQSKWVKMMIANGFKSGCCVTGQTDPTQAAVEGFAFRLGRDFATFLAT
jgi:hypothetical protein